MYLRTAHAEGDLDVLRDLIRRNPLGILVTAIPSDNFSMIQATHIPWVMDEEAVALGRLRGHMARQNPHAKALIEAIEKQSSSGGQLEQEVYILFNGSADAYVTPKFYTKTKPETGKVVPTWNYSAAQVYGRARVYCDSHSEETHAYLQQQIIDLTTYSEDAVVAYMGGDNSARWKVSDAPATFIDILRKNIIGIEIEIDRLEGKFKMSQEVSDGDREGVVRGFKALDTDQGTEIARTVGLRSELKEAARTAP